MTARHLVLSIGAALVLGLGVYLLVEVHVQPASIAPPTPRAPHRADVAPRAADPAEPAPEAARPPPRSPERPVRAPQPAGSPTAVAGPPGAAAAVAPPELDPGMSGPKLDAIMAEANKAYDHGDFEEAKTIAGRLLAVQPANVRMLRIMVSASCIDGDVAVAQASFVKLPPDDQAQMRTRCSRYGIVL